MVRTPRTEGKKATPAREQEVRSPLEHIAEALRGLRYGTVTVVVQDGVIVQLERLERRRFQRGVPLGDTEQR